MFLQFTNFFLIVIILFLLAIVLRKVKKIHLWSYEIQNELTNKTENIISQIEALLGLYAELDLTKSIPKTRGWAGSPDFLWNIARLAQKNKPRVVVECSSGVSTIVLAQALKLNGVGHVYSLEHDSVFVKKTREELERHGLNDYATVIYAPLISYEINGSKWKWYSLDNYPENIKIDFLVIDGPPAVANNLARYPAGPLLLGNLTNQSIAVMDDYNRIGEKEIFKNWEEESEYKFEKYEIKCEEGCLVFIKKLEKKF